MKVPRYTVANVQGKAPTSLPILPIAEVSQRPDGARGGAVEFPRWRVPLDVMFVQNHWLSRRMSCSSKTTGYHVKRAPEFEAVVL